MPQHAKRTGARRVVLTWFLIAGFGYAGWCALIFAMQDRMIFLPRYAGDVPQSGPTLDGVRVIRHDIGGGGSVEAWFAPAEDGRCVVFCHGNAELIHHNQHMIGLYRGLGWGVLMVEYRGYGESDGAPGQRAIASDAAAVIDVLVREGAIDPDRLVYHGRSLGGGVACAIAELREPRALILESTFTSVAGFATRYGVPPVLVRHPFRNDRTVSSFGGPVLLLHGEADRLIPIAHAERLEERASSATLVRFPGADHNTFPVDWSLYESSIAAFLRDL